MKTGRWILIALLIYSSALSAKGDGFPSVKEWSGEVRATHVDDVSFERPIHSADGRKLYELRCHNGGYDHDPEYVYSGLLACWLKSLTPGDDVDSLLRQVPKQSGYWETRGLFLPGHVHGVCAQVPDWGRHRTFLVRGMKITIEITNAVFSKERTISSYRLRIKVENAPEARTSISAPPRLKQPDWFDTAGSTCEDAIARARALRQERR